MLGGPLGSCKGLVLLSADAASTAIRALVIYALLLASVICIQASMNGDILLLTAAMQAVGAYYPQLPDNLCTVCLLGV